jgi:hypothetical protein
VHPTVSRDGQLLREKYRAECVNELSAVRRVLKQTMRHERHGWFLTDVARRETEEIAASLPDVHFTTVLTTRPHRLFELERSR